MRGFWIAVPLVLAVTSFGENRWESHGYNYSYTPADSPGESRVIFPIAWDIRSASNLILAWQRIYEPAQSNPIIPILQEAMESGFNTAVVRVNWAICGFRNNRESLLTSFSHWQAGTEYLPESVFYGEN